MKVFVLFSVFFICINLQAKDKQFSDYFSKGEKQRLALLINGNHYLKPQVRNKDLIDKLKLNSFLSTLDPYSRYFNSVEISFKKKRDKLTRQGIGLDLLIENNRILAIPIKDGPAYRSGFKTPKYISRIDKQKINPMLFESYKFLSSFPVGKIIEIETQSKLLENIYKVETKFFEQQHVFLEKLNEYNVLTIRKFSDQSTMKIKKVISSVSKKKPLVIDIRHNPGGDLYATVDTLSFFLDDDLSVAYLEDRDNLIPLQTISTKIVPKRKIILLVSSFTASSAEIFAQAIKNYLPETILMGGATSGKCLAQETHHLPNGSAIQLSKYQVLNSTKESCQNIQSHIDIYVDDMEIISLTKILTMLRVKLTKSFT